MQSEKPSSPSNSNSHIKSPQAKSPIKSPNVVAKPGQGRGEEGLEWTEDDKEGSRVYVDDFEDFEEDLDGEEAEEGREVGSGCNGAGLVDLPAPVSLSNIQPSPLRRPLLSRPQRAAAVKMGRAEGSTSTLLLAERSAEL